MSGTSTPAPPSLDHPAGTQSPESTMSFQFVNLKHPSDTKDQNARRAIRSHVTKQQHQKAEQLAAAAARRSNSDPHLSDPSSKHGQQGRAHASSFPLHPLAAPGQQSPVSPSSSSDASFTATSPMTRHPLLDVTQIYPAHWIPYLNPILENYAVFTAKEVLQADDMQTHNLLRTVWMPFVFTDIALLHAVLLFATSLFGCSLNPQRHALDLLQLKDMAIQAMNESLNDAARSTSDSMIATIAVMAQYEAFWGDIPAFSTHKTGLRQFVQQRGGLGALGLNGLLESILVAIDHHTARTTGLEISMG